MSKRQKENILLFIVNIFFVIVCFLVLVEKQSDPCCCYTDHLTWNRNSCRICFFKKKVSWQKSDPESFDTVVCISFFAIYDSIV